MPRLIAALLLAFLFAAPVHAAPAAKESTYDRVMRTQTIRCGYGISPPVLVRDANTGRLSGMDVDVWTAIGHDLGLKIEWVESSGWGTFPDDLRAGKYDAYCSQIWMNAARTKFLTVTMPVAYTFLNSYVRPDETRYGADMNVFNAAGITIPAVDGDITEEMSRARFPRAKIDALPGSSNWGDLYLAVATRKADVFFTDPASFAAVSRTSPVKLKKINTTPVFTFGSRYSVAIGEFALRDMVNVELQKMIDDGSLKTRAASTSPYITVPDKNYSPAKP